MHPPAAPTPPAPGSAPVPGQPPAIVAQRVSRALLRAAAARLVPQRGDIAASARRLMEQAPLMGLDLSLVWVTTDAEQPPMPPTAAAGARPTGGLALRGGAGRPPQVRQACMACPGSGRTATLFLSEPPPGGDREAVLARRERAACVRAACAHLGTLAGRVVLAQSLPAPDEVWALEPFADAGFVSVGTLIYLRRGLAGAGVEPPSWPAGVRLTTVSMLTARLGRERADAVLVDLLDRTYIDTLDCPELCGLRTTPDILASHRATGSWNPELWWVLEIDGKPEGCALFNQCAERDAFELVYMGLAPAARGKGLGGALLNAGLSRLPLVGRDVECAVDERNVPARRLYERLGFRGQTRRVALVCPVPGAPG